MGSNVASKPAYFSDDSGPQPEALSDGPAGMAGLRLSRRASLIAAVMLSLGLWAAIWAAVASVASAMLG